MDADEVLRAKNDIMIDINSKFVRSELCCTVATAL